MRLLKIGKGGYGVEEMSNPTMASAADSGKSEQIRSLLASWDELRDLFLAEDASTWATIIGQRPDYLRLQAALKKATLASPDADFDLLKDKSLQMVSLMLSCADNLEESSASDGDLQDYVDALEQRAEALDIMVGTRATVESLRAEIGG